MKTIQNYLIKLSFTKVFNYLFKLSRLIKLVWKLALL